MTGLKDILLALVMLPFPLVLGLGAASTRGKWRRRAWLAGAALLMSVGLLKSGVALARNFQSQPLWDFHCYWIYGRTITDGRNPYDPAELAITAAPLETTEEFREELLFFYPPPALFVLAPLGWTDIRTACNLWQLVNIAFFLGNIWLLRRFAATLDSPPGFDVLLCLFLTLRGTADTFVFTQVNFMLLTALLLYWLNRDRLVGGGALAAGILLKPFLAFAPLEIVLAQRWWSLAGGLITALLLCLASWTAFGAEVWKSYLWSNPAALQIPDSMFTEPMNQSLLATVLRITGYQFAEHSPYTHPLFLILLTTITLVTTRGVWRHKQANPAWGLGLLVAFGLLAFPKTLAHYSLFLIVPALVLWSGREKIWGGRQVASAIISGAWLCVWWQQAFAGFALFWLALAILNPPANSLDRTKN